MTRIDKVFLTMFLTVIIAACSDDTDFSTDINHRLTFSTDTIAFDTVFSTVGTSRGGMMVYNCNDKDLRISTVELVSGGESGFRVMVDGQYGAFMQDFELRSNDSLYVFVELTSPRNGGQESLMVSDVLRFTLESGLQQEVVLAAYSRDVDFLRALTINSDTVITSGHYVVYDSLVVAPQAVLTVEKGTTLYFHNEVPLIVRGSIVAEGTREHPIVFRGDRTDNMFSYLPYDRIPGQWGGIVLASTSNDNLFEHCDIHSADRGIKMEPGDSSVQRLTIDASRLENFYGHALELFQAHANVTNTLIANAGGNCVKVVGGNVGFTHCTIANFFVYTTRDVALTLHNSYGTTAAPLYRADFVNCIITGTKSDELMGYLTNLGDTVPGCINYRFENSLINTVVGDDENFSDNVIDISDVSPFAKEHFLKIDHDTFLYDFHLTGVSTARALGGAGSLDNERLRYDKDGVERDLFAPDAGCYQYVDVVEE